ncbi:MAG: putative carboxyl-terminal protease [Candidatus Saccharibacteria bacterium]|nr:putative carboxyl-terminal protease [Candidatus Saccharibacteria bacterium]
MVSNRRVRREQLNRVPKAVWVLAFVFVAGVGYIGGTFNSQIISGVGSVFGIKGAGATIDLSSVERTYQDLKANYDGNIDDKALIEGANRGLVDALGDEYTLYMNKKETDEFNNELSGNIGGGIGVELADRSGALTAVRLLRDNPAEKAGLQVNDVISAINGESTTGKSVTESVSKIRGDVGTTVKLTITRGAETKEFTLTRAQVNNPSVYSSIDGTTGIMTITRFDDQTGSLAQEAAREFKDKGVTSVVLDLRGNGGGYVTAAQSVAGLWLDNQVVVSERNNGKVVDELRTGSNPTLKGLPTVVLVNQSSASASEIVAGALQDYGVAQLLGTKTFGKGSVQKLLALPEGAQLKVTIARWYTPKGINISKQGITPNKVVEITQDDITAGLDPQLDAAKAQLK